MSATPHPTSCVTVEISERDLPLTMQLNRIMVRIARLIASLPGPARSTQHA